MTTPFLLFILNYRIKPIFNLTFYCFDEIIVSTLLQRRDEQIKTTFAFITQNRQHFLHLSERGWFASDMINVDNCEQLLAIEKRQQLRRLIQANGGRQKMRILLHYVCKQNKVTVHSVVLLAYCYLTRLSSCGIYFLGIIYSSINRYFLNISLNYYDVSATRDGQVECKNILFDVIRPLTRQPLRSRDQGVWC